MVKLRLAKKNGQATFAIVAIDSRKRRDGKFNEKLGDYNPRLPKDRAERLVINLDSAFQWIDNGAIPTESVARLIKRYSAKIGATLPAKTAALVEKLCAYQVKPAATSAA